MNNRLRLFPNPTDKDNGDKVYFQYYVKDDKQSTTRTYTDSKVSDPSNIPYNFIT